MKFRGRQLAQSKTLGGAAVGPVHAMTDSEKRAFRDTLRIFALVLGVAFIVGVIGDIFGYDRRSSEKAEGFISDLQIMATEIPRLPNGLILRQGTLPTAWLDDVGALPARLQAMSGSLRGRENEHSVGLMRTSPWSPPFDLEAKGSLIWATLQTVPKAVCEQLVLTVAKHPGEIGYIATAGGAPVLPAGVDTSWACRTGFTSVTLITLDPLTELRRLADDIQNAVSKMPANSTDKTFMSGSSAPFEVYRGKEGSAGYLENGPAGIRVTIAEVPLAVCRLALLAGPQAFGMDTFDTPDGKAVQPPRTRVASEALCNASNGQLVMGRR
jgi:hypothetical protein